MKRPNFKVGDKVFAKVKGYPPWPARIVGENGKKYNVEFYGTGETGSIKSEDLFYYLKNKEKFQKPLKRKDYLDAFEQINEAVKNDGGDGDESPDKDDSLAANVTLNASSLTNSVVEKSEKKTAAKRKRALPEETPAETSTPKKKSSRLTRNAEDPQKSEISQDSQEEPEKVSPKKSPKVTKSPKTKEDKRGKKTEEKIEQEVEKAEKPETPEEEAKEQDPVEKKNEELENDDTKDAPKKETEENVETQKSDEMDSKIVIVAEKVLNHNVAYANLVKKTDSYYKEKPVEPREDSPNQVLSVKLPSGVIGGIKLHLKWPLVFENEYDRAIYDEIVTKRVLEAKQKIESGDSGIIEDAETIIPNIEKTEEEIKQLLYAKDIETKKARIARLNLEADLLSLDVKIKNCLGLDKADPQEAIGYLEEMFKLNFDDIVLKKHLHIVEMVRRLRKYVGNTREWKMNDESLNEFTKQAETVREMAEKVYGKFKKTVKLPENCSSFFEGFAELVTKFRTDCKELELTETDIFVLCAEPRSRIAFLNRLEEKESEKENVDGATTTEQEKTINGTIEVTEETS